MQDFTFLDYNFDKNSLRAQFNYRGGDAENPLNFTEIVNFSARAPIDFQKISPTLDRALFLLFILIGTSYYKAFPTKKVSLSTPITPQQASFFNTVYQEGLSQFAYENHYKRENLAHFEGVTSKEPEKLPPLNSDNSYPLVLQSGGKDSLLTAELLNQSHTTWTALYISSTNSHPKILDTTGAESLQIVQRKIDRDNLQAATNLGAKNGHVPVTYINIAIALVQAILNGQTSIITSIGHEGAEPHTIIKSESEPDLLVNHQWSKTLEAEQNLQEYLKYYIAPNFRVSSIIRQYSELKIAELFAKNCWNKYGDKFSSCNQANYQQSADNSKLHWCGNCAKCANSYLLFAPFVKRESLDKLFNNQSLFENQDLVTDFKGLLGVDDQIKPFECVGEVAELRSAYHLKRQEYPNLPFSVPESDFDYNKTY